VAGGHHGGAWKVAYADFVTAMMAFFLLMWLLGATTEKQRKGIADYFAPTLMKMRQGARGGTGCWAARR
jgi:chemotaxis protein MotB